MRFYAFRHLSWAALAAPLALLALSKSASADAVPAGSGTAGTPASPDASASSAPASPPPPPISVPLVGPVEQLGPGAYPNTPIRGIAGGSLASIFHGMQWPYYPKSGIGVSGYVWIDTGYEHLKRGDPAQGNLAYELQQGRAVLRVTPTWSDGKYFAQGQVELVGNKDQSDNQSSTPPQADTDDVWVKTGRWKSWDVQLGRFEAWEVYHFGLGMDLYTLERAGASDGINGVVPTIYGVTYAFYRANLIGQGAVHLYPTEWLRFELGGQYGNETPNNGEAVRPVAIADFGWLKLKAGAEWKHDHPQQDNAKGSNTQYGAGGSAQVVLDPYVEFGVNYAYGRNDNVAQDGNVSDSGSYATYSVGAFANGRIVDGLLVGAGVNYTYLVNKLYDPTLRRYEDYDHWQTFGAVQYYLFKQVYLKAVFGYALANINPVSTDSGDVLVRQDSMLSGRLRVLYVF
jgi:hypothetical protein